MKGTAAMTAITVATLIAVMALSSLGYMTFTGLMVSIAGVLCLLVLTVLVFGLELWRNSQ